MLNEGKFRDYLRYSHNGGGMDESSITSRVSDCLRAERFEGNLDEHFDRDKLQDLISRLAYSTHDQRAKNPLRHKVEINGDWRTGSATLKQAVGLYRAFRESLLQPAPQVSEPVKTGPKPPTPAKVKGSMAAAWPMWDKPTYDDALALAKVVARYAQFLHPEVVRAIAEDNKKHAPEWSRELKNRGIDPNAYLWPGSACAFPGVRRYAGSSEIAIFRKRAPGAIENALALDDNDYPKQVWSFALTGKKFAKHGPPGYALAHLADHKVHKNQAENDFEIVPRKAKTALHGLYTSATNAAYLPLTLIRPTDFSPLLRNLLKRRAAALYADFCAPLPPWLAIRPAPSTDWDLDRFEWPDPVGDPARVQPFLSFRNEKMAALFRQTMPPWSQQITNEK